MTALAAIASPRASIAFWALVAAAGAVGPMALAAPLGLAPLLIVVGAICLIARWPAPPWRGFPAAIGWPLGLTTVWGAVGAAWAIDPAHSLRTAAAFGATTVLGMAAVAAAADLDAGRRRTVGNLLVIGLLLTATLLTIEIAGGGQVYAWATDRPDVIGSHLFRYNRGASVLATLVWVGAWHVWASADRWRWLKVGALLTAVAVAVAMSESESAKLALAVGAGVFALGTWLGRRFLVAAAGLIVVMILVVPAALRLLPDPASGPAELNQLPNSALHRLTIWRFAASKIEERPLLGWGMDASRAFPDGETVVTFERAVERDGVVVRQTVKHSVMPLHPHNVPVQWWLELGVVGGGLLAAVVGAVAWAGARRLRERPEAGFLAALCATSLVTALLSFGAWQSWWLGALWLVAAFARLAGLPSKALDSSAGVV